MRPHAVLVVLDHVHGWQFHECGEVEAFEHLPLVRRAFAEIRDSDAVIAAIPVAECKPCPKAYLRADDAMSAKEVLLFAEHVHRATLAVRVASRPPSQLRHDAARIDRKSTRLNSSHSS